MKTYKYKNTVQAIQYLEDENSYNEFITNKIPVIEKEFSIAIKTSFDVIVDICKSDYVLKHYDNNYTVCNEETFNKYFEEVI